MKLILIRHGLTNYNLKKKYCGLKDISLNKKGRAQAKKISAKLKNLEIDKVFCSDLKRSWQTAKIIFGRSGCPIIKNPGLREINFGECEGLNFKQIDKRYPSLFSKWIKNPGSVNIPGGEKISYFINRIRKEFKKIINNHNNQNVALVVHAGPIRVILNFCQGIKIKDFWSLNINSESIYIIEYNAHSRPKIHKL